MESNTDHLTLCSEKRLRELLQKESDLERLREENAKLRSSICATDLLDKAAECGAKGAFKMVAERYGDDITEGEWMTKWRQRREDIKSLTYNSPSFNKKVHR